MRSGDNNPDYHVHHGYVAAAGKPKFYVPLFRYGTTWYCLLISSLPNEFVRGRPELQPCEVMLSEHQHRSFLKHDSFGYVTTTSVVQMHESEHAECELVGALSRDAQTVLIRAVCACPEIKRRKRDMILAAFSATC